MITAGSLQSGDPFGNGVLKSNREKKIAGGVRDV
jgi:hypothetical protein